MAKEMNEEERQVYNATLALIEAAARENSTGLDFDGMELTVLPPEIGKLTNLKSLQLDGNQLTALPPEIGKLTNLQTLILDDNRLTALPPEIGKLTNLQELHSHSNQLTELPPEIGKLKNLKELRLQHNQFTALPPEIGELENLQTLSLGNNQLTALPPEIGELENLQTLDLSNNQLTELPVEIRELTNLKELTLDGNQLAELPPEIGKLKNLQELSLGSNQLTALSPEIGKLTNLQELQLDSNQLTELPPAIGKLTNLEKLPLFENQLTTLPPEIGKLTNLQVLYLASNSLTALPPEIGKLTNLEELYLFENQLTTLPPEIGNLTNLKNLYLNGNQLTALPPEIGNLTNLKNLYLNGNQLTALPPEIGKLTKLQTLSLDGNPLKWPPQEIVEQGTEAVLAYLRGVEKGAIRNWVSKLLVVGEGGVGKTHLLYALRGEQPPDDLETTHGIEVKPLELAHPEKAGVNMRLNCWDFGGQSIYHATHQFFLTDRSLFLLVWNARVGYEQSKLYYWLDTIKALSPDSPVLLVATHIDERDGTLPYDDLKHKYPNIVGRWEVCCTRGDGIGELTDAITQEASRLPLMGQTWPTAWLDAAGAVMTKKEDNHITKAQLHKIMSAHDVDKGGRTVLSRWMHDLGYILYFDRDEELKDTVLLDPQWVTRKISDVLECDAIVEGLGIFCQEYMDEVWSDITDMAMRDHLLRLMERFDLSYRIPDDPQDRSIVVERLRLDPPDYEDRWDAILKTAGCKEIGMKFDLQSTRPAGIPTWFIARAHRFTTGTHWRYGALFGDGPDCKHLALIVAPPSERYVTLTVRGPSPHNFLALLKDGLELTLRRFPGLDIKRTIPCPGHDEKKCKHEFDFRQLEKAIEREKPVMEIQCQEAFENVPVLKLLFGLHCSTESEIIKRIDKKQDLLLDGQGDILTEISNLRSLAQRQFLTLFNAAQRLEESHCPNVFAIMPVGDQGWVKKKIAGEKLGLHLYCQKPGHWHPTYTGGHYEFTQPAEWLRTMSPYLVKLATLMKYAAPLAGPVAGMASAAFAEQFKYQLKMMEELAKKLGDEGDIGAGELAEGIGKVGRVEQAEGAPLRALRELLDKVDTKHHWGGLKKILTPEGHYLWLCEDHAKEYRI